MIAQFEKRKYQGDERIWTGSYRNLNNMSHWHNECEIIYINKGCAKIYIQNNCFLGRERDCFFVHSEEIHSINSGEDSIITVILFRPELAKVFNKYRFECSKLEHFYDIEKISLAIKTEMEEKKLFSDLTSSYMLFGVLLEMIQTESIIPVMSTQITQFKQYKELLKKIDENYAIYSFDEAANFMGLSRQYFSKYFHKISGMPFNIYLNSVKIQKSIDMLRGSNKLSITEISELCGFNSIRNFNRVFLSLTGYQPSKLPTDFQLNINPIKGEGKEFDPTLSSSKLISESFIKEKEK